MVSSIQSFWFPPLSLRFCLSNPEALLPASGSLSLAYRSWFPGNRRPGFHTDGQFPTGFAGLPTDQLDTPRGLIAILARNTLQERRAQTIA
jgi:hypothetical protein